MKSEMQTGKTNSKKFIAITVMLFLGMLVNFIAAILNGMEEEWVLFGMGLAASVMIYIAFFGVLILWKLNLLSDKFTKSEASVD